MVHLADALKNVFRGFDLDDGHAEQELWEAESANHTRDPQHNLICIRFEKLILNL